MTKRGDTVTVYADHDSQWRWRRQAANGRTIASSGESFDSKTNAVRAARRANPGITVREKVGLVKRIVRAVRG